MTPYCKVERVSSNNLMRMGRGTCSGLDNGVNPFDN